MTSETERYYAERAPEYDRVYAIPRWAGDLPVLRDLVTGFFRGRRVLEVACGTGYWTWHAAREALSVHAEDLNPETLAVARGRDYGRTPVSFAVADAYRLRDDGQRFDGGLAAFWLSHVDRVRMSRFLDAFHGRLESDARVLMFDERPTGTRTLETSRVDAAGNRYEPRTLQSGARFEIIKNWYDAARLDAWFGGYGRELEYRELPHFWVLTYRVRRSAE